MRFEWREIKIRRQSLLIKQIRKIEQTDCSQRARRKASVGGASWTSTRWRGALFLSTWTGGMMHPLGLISLITISSLVEPGRRRELEGHWKLQCFISQGKSSTPFSSIRGPPWFWGPPWSREKSVTFGCSSSSVYVSFLYSYSRCLKRCVG